MKIALAQINSTVGDLEGNIKRMLSFVDRARESKAELLVFPESALTGNPLQDLLHRPDFVHACRDALDGFISHTDGIGVLMGIPFPVSDTDRLQKSAVLIENGKVAYWFDDHLNTLDFRGIRIGVIPGEGWRESTIPHAAPDLLINLSAFPYYFNGLQSRIKALSGHALGCGVPLLSVNQAGGNDELIFDGSSMVFDKKGNLTHLGKHFEEDLLIFDTHISHQPIAIPEEDVSWIYSALVLGFRDYFRKTGFTKALLGLSGGIDSALVACIAADALEKENVLGVYMPSRYSSYHSGKDAEQLAVNLGIEYRVLPIEEIFTSYIRLINGSEETRGDLAEENIQARIRGSLLMFISNRESRMLVNTSNKSEFAVGYTTLYGDMCGSLSPIADIPKTMVYKLCNYINRDWERIPVNTITKPPSAELRPDQLDQDSLPDYDVLDGIIQLYVEENLSANQIVQRGFQKELVLKIIGMIDGMEYKRRQAPPVLKITSHALGVDGRMPIIQRFKRH